MDLIRKEIEFAGRKLTLSKGGFAEQAGSAVMASYGETVVLATVVASTLEEDKGYFPLNVEYQDRLYAGGRIKGSRWVKREGKPTDDAILNARLVDRSIRPLFYKGYNKDVQVILTVLSVDLENSPKIVASIAASAAITTSDIPWQGPVGIVSIGMKDGSFFTNPLDSELPYSELDLTVAATKDALVMIEAGAKEVPEEQIFEGLEYAQKEALKLINFINDFASAFPQKKADFVPEKKDKVLKNKVKKVIDKSLAGFIKKLSVKEAGDSELKAMKKVLSEELSEEDGAKVAFWFEELLREEIRSMALKGKRADGRKLNEIRNLTSQVSILPRTHGSAIFTRGQTQALTVTTLGAPSLGQLIETAEGEEEKRYIHHYSMPPYSIGETGRVGSPSRREIGHGALAEKALLPVIPPESVFPYTIRVVSEVLSSNGSTSMASTCGSTLSLMDAGVPILSPVAGIAMGVVVESLDKYVVLSDISGIEDGNGDMDFKVAGTKRGITAIQLDVKTLRLTASILKEALAEAKKGRLEILESMLRAIPEPRSKVSTYAPKIKTLKVDPEKIGEVIGPGGRMIKKIVSETGAQVKVDDDGTVSVYGMNDEAVSKAVSWVESIVKEVKPGEIYEGEVKRIQPFGAFVGILPGKEGLVHVSDMSEDFVSDPERVVKVGDKVKVRVKEIDSMGRLNLSMILDPSKEKQFRSKPRNTFNRKSRSSAPHFSASHYVSPKRQAIRGHFRRK